MSETKVAQLESHEFPNGSIESKWEVSFRGKRYPVTFWGMPANTGMTWSYMTSHLREEGAAHGFTSLDQALDDFISRLENRHRPLAHRLIGKRHAPRRQVQWLANGHVPQSTRTGGQTVTDPTEAD